MLLGGVVAAVTFWTFAHETVAVLFQRGAFAERDTRIVAGIFQFSLLQLPCYFALLVSSSLLASAKAFGLILSLSFWFIVVKVLTIYGCLDALGLRAVVLSNGVAYTASFLLLLAILIKKGGLST